MVLIQAGKQQEGQESQGGQGGIAALLANTDENPNAETMKI